jgi:hypothetical protein
MPCHSRVFESRPMAFLDERVAMTDPAGLDLDTHLIRGRLGYGSLHNLEWCPGASHMDSGHLWHIDPLSNNNG